MCERCAGWDEQVLEQLQEINELQQQVIMFRTLMAPLRGERPAVVVHQRAQVQRLLGEVIGIASGLAGALGSRHCGCQDGRVCGRCASLAKWEQWPGKKKVGTAETQGRGEEVAV